MGRITVQQMTEKVIVVHSDCLGSNTMSKTGSRVLMFKAWRNQQGMKWNFADPQYTTQRLIAGIACMLHVYLTISLACVYSWGLSSGVGTKRSVVLCSFICV